MPAPLVVLVRVLKIFWTYVHFPEIPQLDPKPMNHIMAEALFELNDLDLRMFQTNAPTCICFRNERNRYEIIQQRYFRANRFSSKTSKLCGHRLPCFYAVACKIERSKNRTSTGVFS